MTWTWNNTWMWNHPTQTYILNHPAGRAYVWQDKPSPTSTRHILKWNGRVVYNDGTKAYCRAENDHRPVMGHAEWLLDHRQESDAA